ncbi:hypothetical protein [Streptomyces echinatus]|uniref:Uncharacterized protein n=1 Tax=Streptomyces echinatus TaxID=67293 RepID=A0A7W9Q3M5_9ACTN|nr:hypothetical protein [Streptomyces echinatus]MBB5932202.1 hypothetical protein [Streptomyces echinatus]
MVTAFTLTSAQDAVLGGAAGDIGRGWRASPGEDYDVQWRRCREATEAVQAAITAHADETGANRYELEQLVKTTVCHAEEDPTE